VEAGPDLTSEAEPDASVPFAVVFEDAHLIVVDKPAGDRGAPCARPPLGHARERPARAARFCRRTSRRARSHGPLRPGIVHRIDKDTSGLLMVAKDALTREGLKRQLAAHSVTRVYQALTQGAPVRGASTRSTAAIRARDCASRRV
jgi:23S rRNA pseudouridine1911/1915/1917 synthase